MSKSFLGTASAIGLLVAVLPVAARAETPSVELQAGYSFLRDGSIAYNLPLGFSVSVAANTNDWLGFVGDVDVNHKDFGFPVDLGAGTTVTQYTFLGGPRFSTRASERVVPFGQFLAGFAHATPSIVWLSYSRNSLVLQPGGGVDFRVAENVAFRVGGDYRLVFEDNLDSHIDQFRLTLGVVFAFGR